MFSDFSSIMRYGLPGWTFLINLLLPYFIAYASDAETKPAWLLAQIAQPGVVSAVGAIGALAALPIGFVVYQSYFYLYWIRADKEDWGGWSNIPFETAKGTRIAPALDHIDSNNSKAPTHDRWFLVEQHWYELLATKSKDGIALLSGRATRLFDLYHSLGAISTALYLSTSVHMLNVNSYAVFIQWRVLVPYVLLMSFILVPVHANRMYARRNLVSYQNGVMRHLEGLPVEMGSSKPQDQKAG